jgi:hypothetical protein
MEYLFRRFTASPECTRTIPVVQPEPISILHGLTFRDFAISPDGRMLAVVPPGKRNLLIFRCRRIRP